MRKSAQTVIRPDAYYTIAAANGRVLEVADFNTENGASVRLWSYEGQPWQQWQFVEAGGRASTASGTALRVRSWTWPCPASATAPGSTSGGQTAGAGQRWQIVEAGGGKVKLRNVLADKVIDWWECAWRTALRPRSGRMSLARTSSGSSTLCPSAC